MGPGSNEVMRHATFFLISTVALSGCSAAWYRSSADEEVAEILRHERKSVLGEENRFVLTQVPSRLESEGKAGETEDLRRTPEPKPVILSLNVQNSAQNAPGVAGASNTPVPDGAQSATGASPSPVPLIATHILDLRGALRLAFHNNRDYQAQKEALYLSALSLTLAQHQFAPRFLGIITGDWSRDSNGEAGSVAPSTGWNLLFVNGARLSVTVVQSFFQFFTGDRREVAQTIVGGSLTQPLLRGFGTEVVREPLTQAERGVTYQVRAFERFRKTFAVIVITEFYRVLENRDRVSNSYLNWQSLVTNRDRVEALANAQKRPPFEVGQARQDELRAQDEWSSAAQIYESALDRFKVTLGITADQEVTLLQDELLNLIRESVEPLDRPVEEAIQAALLSRLDLKTERDLLEDSIRRIRVGEDGLRAQLDLNANAALASSGGRSQTPLKLNSANGAYGFGFDLNLPLDRKAERNAYVAALIDLESRKRSLSLFEDSVRLTVRDAYRRLEREIVSFRIQKISLALAAERVESTSLFFQAGRAETRDVLEAQASLNTARNALTSALINYAVARLEVLRDTESLRVTDGGEVILLPLRKEI